MKDKTESMEEMIAVLNEAAKAYYTENREIMSNMEYDKLYDELAGLEKETGITLSGSPTVSVGYEVMEELPKERHEEQVLSLNKTKDPGALGEFLAERQGILSWKYDGLTIVVTYSGGRLVKALTRGKGDAGEVITSNARTFGNLPVTISFEGELVLRGEAVIRYSDFEKINATIPDIDAKYKNPRNLCSGSVRQLNSRVTAERNVRLYVFALVSARGKDDLKPLRHAQMEWLKSEGFEVAEYKIVDKDNIEETVQWFADNIAENDIPSDGLVLSYDDIAYGKSLGSTSKYPRDSIAFKWKDELKETTLLEIEWSASRTGLINPIAIFEPVELEGTTVSRASVHNISIMRELKLGVGDRITVYKANMIIPQIAENLTGSGDISIPETCPVCGGGTEIRSESGVLTLICVNDDCLAKHIKFFTHFVSRDAMNIEGLSEATIEKFIAGGIIKAPADLFKLRFHRDEIVVTEGFGEKSYNNLTASADRARKTTPARLLYALGVPNIGLSNAKNISKHCGGDFETIRNISREELSEIYGVGDVMAEVYVNYFNSEKSNAIIGEILDEIEFEDEGTGTSQALAGETFVITGSLTHFDNREALIAVIEKHGGGSASSVSAKTGFLVNNDPLSGSTKNKKAKELGVRIITEEELLAWIEKGKIDA